SGGDPSSSNIAVGSGYPVSAFRPGLVGVAALEAIADSLLSDTSFSQLEEFDGPFLVVIYRPKTQQLIVARDKFGLRQAYFCSDERGLVLSDDISVLRDRWKSVRT